MVLYQKLRDLGLVKRGKLNSKTLERLPFKNLLDVLDDVSHATTVSTPGLTQSHLHAASV
jgi:hypothetical protein